MPSARDSDECGRQPAAALRAVNPRVSRSTPAPSSDFQRGELLFALRNGPTGLEPHYDLPVRYVTRVHADEATGAALPAANENYINVGTFIQTGQIVAFADVPYQTPPGTYYVFIERWRRISATSSQFEQLAAKMINFDSASLPWRAWSGFIGYAYSPEYGMTIRVVSLRTDCPVPQRDLGLRQVEWKYSQLNYTEDLNHLVPNLKLGSGSEILHADVSGGGDDARVSRRQVRDHRGALGRINRSGGLVSGRRPAPSACGAERRAFR
jgi:hypothetical protein